MPLYFSPVHFCPPLQPDLRKAAFSHSPSTNSVSSHFHLMCTFFPYRQDQFKRIMPLTLSFVSTSETFYASDFPDEVPKAGGEVQTASPWEGAVVYRRDPSETHVEYSSTLERLGLLKLSSALSRSKASAMGIRLPARMTKNSNLANETPVLISIDVTRRKRRLKLDGILRAVIALRCYWCADPTAESIFSNFTLLLTEDPVDENQDINDVGVTYSSDFTKSARILNYEAGEDDEKLIDQDDKLHFPAEDKEIDISKQIRDLLHVEITMNTYCSVGCKGLCLKCGINLNKHTCTCNQEEEEDTGYGPIGEIFMDIEQRRDNCFR